ncbi:hypothetical protein [Inquilinus limosus]|uniref:Argininosuccinate lyase n=1 Tax=Inquilinus limosus TaxID=171674 RepID=A0A211ZEG5_9PROT|nr:hypothetical protein [Inquilinus limosus]OWJ63554.1 hypothetical protein BWR60_29115 [Inquilinus limosus]
MHRLILAAAGLSLLTLAACGSDEIPIDRPIMQGEPAPPAVPTEPIQRQPLSAPPSSLTGQQDPAQSQTTPPAK